MDIQIRGNNEERRNANLSHQEIRRISQRIIQPTDQDSSTTQLADIINELTIIRNIEMCMWKLENSHFYRTFLEQVRSPQVSDSIHKVLGFNSSMQMVIYGIGNIGNEDAPRFQFCLALLMKKEFNWIGDIEVYDPALSALEIRVLKSYGWSVLSTNEEARRCALKPTFFFMPHCHVDLYDNLMGENWEARLLRNIILLGNSFKGYEECYNRLGITDMGKNVLAIRKFAHEHKVQTLTSTENKVFGELSWHFFHLGL